MISVKYYDFIDAIYTPAKRSIPPMIALLVNGSDSNIIALTTVTNGEMYKNTPALLALMKFRPSNHNKNPKNVAIIPMNNILIKP
jgi:hypothetical protein